MAESGSKVMDVFLIILLAALIVPIAFEIFFGTNTTGWSDTVVTIWDNLPVLAAVGLLLLFLPQIRRGMGR